MKYFLFLLANLCCLLPGIAWAAPIHDAIYAGDLSGVTQILNAGEDVNETDESGQSPLQIVAREGKDEIAKLLVERGADVNMDQAGTGSPLRLAAMGRHYRIIELLLDHGAESADSQEAATLLVHAVSEGNLATINKLLSRKVDVDATPINPEPNDEEDYTHYANALQTALQVKRSDIVQLLIKNGASVSVGDQVQVVCLNDLNLVKQVIPQGSKVESAVLARSVECPNREVLAYLMANAGQLDYADIVRHFSAYTYFDGGAQTVGISKDLFQILFAGDTDLKVHATSMLANALATGNHELLQFLFDKGAQLLPEDGESYLLQAAQNGQAEVVELLLKRGVSPEARSGWGNTPLLRAVPYDQIKVAALLLQNGANVNAKNELFNTPLHMAAARDLVDMSDLLIKQGARVNAINGDGNTPLLQAARFPAEFNVLKLLLVQKVNVNAQNKRGMTALHYLAIRKTDYRDYDEAPDARGYADPDGLAPSQRPSGWELDEGKRNEAIKLLVAAGADPNIRNARGESALDLARRYSVGAEIVRLLEAKAAEAKPQ